MARTIPGEGEPVVSSDQDFGPRDDRPIAAHEEGLGRIGVHVLTEFVFCPRSGMFVYEEGRADTGEESDGPPRLDYIPDYHRPLIEEALSRIWREIWRFLTFAPPVALAIALVGMFLDGWVALALALSCLFFVPWLCRLLEPIPTLSERLRAAQNAVPTDPNPALGGMQDVNWWGLIAAGYEPIKCRESYRDDSLGLAGRPWRLLCRGQVRIPVFRKSKGDPQLFPQHYVRMAAYSHLIQVSEGAQVPFTVVLFGYGYDGVVLFCDQHDHKRMLSSLATAHQIVEAAITTGEPPDQPERPAVCRNCWYGLPRTHWPGKTEIVVHGELFKAYLAQGQDGRMYHSICGDRYRWVAPHDEARAKGLL